MAVHQSKNQRKNSGGGIKRNKNSQKNGTEETFQQFNNKAYYKAKSKHNYNIQKTPILIIARVTKNYI